MPHGQGESEWIHSIYKEQMYRRVLCVKAAHRLDYGRVRRFPDWAICPGGISGRCLKMRANNKKTNWIQNKSNWFTGEGFSVSWCPTGHWSLVTNGFLCSCWNKHSDRSSLWNTTSKLLTAKTCASLAGCHAEINISKQHIYRKVISTGQNCGKLYHKS